MIRIRPIKRVRIQGIRLIWILILPIEHAPRVSSIGESGLSASRQCSPSNAGPMEQNKGVVCSMYACQHQDLVKAVQKRQKSISTPATPGVGAAGVVGLHSKYTYSGFDRIRPNDHATYVMYMQCWLTTCNKVETTVFGKQ